MLTTTGPDSGKYTFLPKLKKVEDQFYRYDGEPFNLVIYYRDAKSIKIFHNRRRLQGSDLGVFDYNNIYNFLNLLQ